MSTEEILNEARELIAIDDNRAFLSTEHAMIHRSRDNRAALVAEIERLREIVEPRMKSMHVEGSEVEIALEPGVAFEKLATLAANALTDAPNFKTTTVEIKKHGTLEKYTFTLARDDGQSVARKLAEQREEIERLTAHAVSPAFIAQQNDRISTLEFENDALRQAVNAMQTPIVQASSSTALLQPTPSVADMVTLWAQVERLTKEALKEEKDCLEEAATTAAQVLEGIASRESQHQGCDVMSFRDRIEEHVPMTREDVDAHMSQYENIADFEYDVFEGTLSSKKGRPELLVWHIDVYRRGTKHDPLNLCAAWTTRRADEAPNAS